MKILQVDFSYPGVMGDEMASQLKALADSINQEDGFIWKIWTENQQEALGGGIYLFTDEHSATKYLEMHRQRLHGMGVTGIRGVIFDINSTLTAINKGPVGEINND